LRHREVLEGRRDLRAVGIGQIRETSVALSLSRCDIHCRFLKIPLKKIISGRRE